LRRGPHCPGPFAGTLFVETLFWALAALLATLLLPLHPVTARAAGLSLENAVRLALENSLALEAAALSVREAEVNLAQAEANNLVQPSPAALLQARSGLEVAKLQYLLAQFDVKLEVEEAYYGVLRARNLAQVAREAVDLARRQLEIAEDRFAQGAHTQAELLEARSHLAEMEANLAQAEASLGIALLNFERVVAGGFGSGVEPAEVELGFEPRRIDVEADVAFAMENRVERRQLDAAIEAAAKQVELAENDYTPLLALEAARVALAKLQNQKAQLLLGIELEVRQAAARLDDAARRVAVQAQKMETARENLRVAEQLYAAQTATITQVMGAQVALAQAKADYVHAIFDYNLASAQYDRAVARPFEQGEVK